MFELPIAQSAQLRPHICPLAPQHACKSSSIHSPGCSSSPPPLLLAGLDSLSRLARQGESPKHENQYVGTLTQIMRMKLPPYCDYGLSTSQLVFSEDIQVSLQFDLLINYLDDYLDSSPARVDSILIKRARALIANKGKIQLGKPSLGDQTQGQQARDRRDNETIQQAHE